MPPGEARVLGPVAQPEWEVSITGTVGEGDRSPVLSFRAGYGIATLLQDAPLRKWAFITGDTTRSSLWGAGSYVRADEPFVPGWPKQGLPSDIVTVDEESFSWFLDRTTGRIIAEDVGGYRHSITRLRVDGEVRTACAVNGHVAFLDTAHPNAVQLQSLEPPFGVRSLPIAQRLLSSDVKKRDVLRFGGSPDGPCVLRSAHLPGVLVVSDSAVVALGPFVAGIESSEGPHASWRSRLASILGRGRDERVVNALDATSFPGGVAVLFAGRSPEAGRVIDLYAESGSYLGTIHLAHRALRIAGAGQRIVVLSRRDERSYLTSYVLPPQARKSELVDEVVAHAPRAPLESTAPPAESLAADTSRPQEQP